VSGSSAATTVELINIVCRKV